MGKNKIIPSGYPPPEDQDWIKYTRTKEQMNNYINLLEKHSAKAVYQYYDVDGNYLTEVWFEPNDCIK